MFSMHQQLLKVLILANAKKVNILMVINAMIANPIVLIVGWLQTIVSHVEKVSILTKIKTVKHVNQDAMHAQMALTVINVTWMVHIELNQNAIVLMIFMKKINKFVVHALKIVDFAQMQQIAMNVITI